MPSVCVYMWLWRAFKCGIILHFLCWNHVRLEILVCKNVWILFIHRFSCTRFQVCNTFYTLIRTTTTATHKNNNNGTKCSWMNKKWRIKKIFNYTQMQHIYICIKMKFHRISHGAQGKFKKSNWLDSRFNVNTFFAMTHIKV